MIRKAERESMKAVGMAWAVAVVAGCFILGGCAPTTGTNREYDIPVSVTSNTGTVNITLEMKVDATSSSEQEAYPVISPTTRLQLTEGGSTAAGEASTLKDVASTLRNKLNSDNTTDNSVHDSNNPSTSTTTTPTVPDEVIVDEVDDQPAEELAEETE